MIVGVISLFCSFLVIILAYLQFFVCALYRFKAHEIGGRPWEVWLTGKTACTLIFLIPILLLLVCVLAKGAIDIFL